MGISLMRLPIVFHPDYVVPLPPGHRFPMAKFGRIYDVLLGDADCDSDPLTQGCLDTIDYVADTMENMLDDMYVAGLDDCVWLGYYNLPRTEAEKNEALAHCYTLYPAIFGSSAMNASLIDPRPYISASHVKSDDIHPTYGGSVILANLIWDEMVAQNMYR